VDNLVLLPSFTTSPYTTTATTKEKKDNLTMDYSTSNPRSSFSPSLISRLSQISPAQKRFGFQAPLDMADIDLDLDFDMDFTLETAFAVPYTIPSPITVSPSPPNTQLPPTTPALNRHSFEAFLDDTQHRSKPARKPPHPPHHHLGSRFSTDSDDYDYDYTWQSQSQPQAQSHASPSCSESLGRASFLSSSSAASRSDRHCSFAPSSVIGAPSDNEDEHEHEHEHDEVEDANVNDWGYRPTTSSYSCASSMERARSPLLLLQWPQHHRLQERSRSMRSPPPSQPQSLTQTMTQTRTQTKTQPIGLGLVPVSCTTGRCGCASCGAVDCQNEDHDHELMLLRHVEGSGCVCLLNFF